jgi:NAD(P)-dependent dehydrogenase (short-subunit alcohol dehydrogenase family)
MKENESAAIDALQGKAALVTGGGSGIGRAVCHRLARAGAAVAVADHNRDRAHQVRDEIAVFATGPAPVALVADVREEADAEQLARKTVEAFSRIDFLVHSAGVLRLPGVGPRLMHQISKEECDLVIDTNLKGTFLVNRAVLPVMIRQKSGHIVNLSSTSGRIGRAFDSVYCASKFGVMGLTESLAEEMKQFGVKVSAVLPDAVATPLWDQNGPIPPPDPSLDPDRVAGVIEYLLAMPRDVSLENIVVMPFKSRRRKERKPPDGSPSG